MVSLVHLQMGGEATLEPHKAKELLTPAILVTGCQGVQVEHVCLQEAGLQGYLLVCVSIINIVHCNSYYAF